MTSEGSVAVLLGDPKRAIRVMAFPLFLALVVTEINTLADRAWCAGLGTDALAAVALCGPIYLVLTGLGTGLGVGGAATVARAIGSGDDVKARSCAINSLMFAVIFGIVLAPILVLLSEDILVLIGSGDVTAVATDFLVPMVAATPIFVISGVIAGLLRGEGAAKVSTMIMVVLALANIVLDPILIYSMDMGIAGASYATVTATLLSLVIGLVYYFRHGYVASHGKGIRPGGESLRAVLRAGVPQMAEYTVMYSMNLVLNYLVVWCAGSEGLAIYSVPNMVVNLALLPAYAIGSALVPVVSASYGRKDLERMREAYSYSLKAALLTVSCIALILFVIPDPLLYPFTYSDDTVGLRDGMVEALRVFSLCIPFYCLIPLGASMLQAVGLPNRSLVCALVRNLIFIALYAVGAVYGLYWIYWAVVIGSAIGGFMLWYAARSGMRGLGINPEPMGL